jgi:hypothetical protein
MTRTAIFRLPAAQLERLHRLAAQTSAETGEPVPVSALLRKAVRELLAKELARASR